MLLKSLIIIGATLGIVIGTISTAVPWLFPGIFTHDKAITNEAGRDLRYISFSMTGCFAVAGLLVLLLSNGGFGLKGCWFALVGFQWARFSLALVRLLSGDGVLYSEDTSRYAVQNSKAA